ncbi:hypothetical protein BCR36DRAFT_583895 [Piromyces finnis]|uniref:Uncharacterized protein n=1 Tax=Piromyces finnis TaxID=1754191 RepID=A0A1Y1V7T7_9FUNG|nr:hypothetical protein BCR36DRAFT_583895 [Piromyces finnis]|eukprot:ORX49299.1 hypothetical protein BCR36DRAFT_583895 [Piromyces finnis]
MASHHSNGHLMSLASKINHSKHQDKKSEKSKNLKKHGFLAHLLPHPNENDGSIQQLHAIQMIV